MACADDGMGDSGNAMYIDDQQQALEEFIRTQPLPQCVSVTGGSFMSRDATITRGDVLLLRSKSPTSIALSFVDKDGQREELAVRPDIDVQFLALPPKDTGQTGHDCDRAGSSRPISMVTYPTVADLLMDCPTYFEANSTYDDPYLPGFSVKPGDRFYYVKVVRDVAGDKTKRLQCRTESGELVCLSTKCKGNFTVVKDDTTYTLQQLIDLAKVPRRLQVAVHGDVQEEKLSGSSMESEMLEKLLKCGGVINMSRPQEMLEVSPWDTPETTWHVPMDSNLNVRLFSATDYEEPVVCRRIKPEPISAFIHEHEDQFPVQAAILSYIKPPDVISENLHSSREIIVHEKLRTQRLFVKDSTKEEFFAIDESVDISFVQIPQTLSSVFEMMSLPLGSCVRVLADVAADFPEPFILRYGDVLRVTKHDSFSWKFKHSSTGDVPIVKCERLVQGKKAEKLKLPLDLEVSLVLLEDSSQLKVTKLSDIFSGRDEIPHNTVSVLEGKGASYQSLPSSLQVLDMLTDCELLMSPLSSTTAISPLIKSCVRIPVRHKLVLGFKRKLEFPDGYFVLPSKEDAASLGIERVPESEYEELVQARKVATDYEEMVFSPCREPEDDTRSQASSTGRSRYAVNQETVPKSGSSGTLERRRRKDRMRRLSQALNPRNWHLGRGGKEPAEEENPPPPVSGILTLSLQPSHAVANEYTEKFTPDSENMHDTEQAREGEAAPDDTYEDVDLYLPPEGIRAQADGAHHRPHPVSGATCSDTYEAERDASENSERKGRRRRRKSDPGFKLSVQTERPTTPSSPGCQTQRKPPERCRTGVPPEEELERAPPVRSPRFPENRDQQTHFARKEQRKPSHDSIGNESGKDSVSSEDYAKIWEIRRKDHIDHAEAKREITKEKDLDSHVMQTRTTDSPSANRRKHHKPQSQAEAYLENQSTGELTASERSRKPEPRQPEHTRKTRTVESEKPRKSKSPEAEKHRRSRSPERDQTKKPRSPDADSTRKPKPPDREQSRHPRSQSSHQFTEQTGCRQSPPPQRSRMHDRQKHTSPHSGTPETTDTAAQSRDKQPERNKEERKKREKKFPSTDQLIDQPETVARKAQSPRAARRLLQSEQLSPERTQSPGAERRTLQQKQNKSGMSGSTFSERTPVPQSVSGNSQPSGSEDSPVRPRRPRRKRDASSDKLDRSMDSLDSRDDLSTPVMIAAKQDKAVKEKPAVPPKPVFSLSQQTPGSPANSKSKSSRHPPPVAPRRKRAERIGSTEAETFNEDPPNKPVLGRKRLS